MTSPPAAADPSTLTEDELIAATRANVERLRREAYTRKGLLFEDIRKGATADNSYEKALADKWKSDPAFMDSPEPESRITPHGHYIVSNKAAIAPLRAAIGPYLQLPQEPTIADGVTKKRRHKERG